MRQISGGLAALLLALALTACGASGTSTETASPATSEAASAPAEPTAAPSAAASAPAEPTAAPSAAASPSAEASTVAEPSAAAEPSASPAASSAEQASPAASAAAETATETGADAGAVRRFAIVPEESQASYDVQEQFLEQNLPARAVGTTRAVEGELEFNAQGQPTGRVTRFRVDLRTLTSDRPRRDSAIRTRWLESDTYPYADFVSTGVQDVPAAYTEGEEVSFKLIGDLTIRNVTREVTWDVTGRLQGDIVTGRATTLINMVDFGFDPPSIAGVLTVEDGVTITLDFTAREQ